MSEGESKGVIVVGLNTLLELCSFCVQLWAWGGWGEASVHVVLERLVAASRVFRFFFTLSVTSVNCVSFCLLFLPLFYHYCKLTLFTV